MAARIQNKTTSQDEAHRILCTDRFCLGGRQSGHHRPIAARSRESQNTEGDFVRLKDGRFLFIYSKVSSSCSADSGEAFEVFGFVEAVAEQGGAVGAAGGGVDGFAGEDEARFAGHLGR